MSEKKTIIGICQSGGVFEISKDGSMSYRGGDAHAIDIDENMKFNELKAEVAEMFSFCDNKMSFKYFLPGNKKTLITISNDKDLKRMISFHRASATIEIYIKVEEVVVPEFSNMLTSRSSRTTLSEAVMAVDDNLDDDENTDLLDIPVVTPSEIMEDTTSDDLHIDISTDIHPTLLPIHSNDERHIKAAQQWQNTITGVGQRFNSVHEFREALRKYAIAHQFAFRYKKNDSHRVTVKCKAEGCPWRIHASRLSTTQLICIKKMNSAHVCEGGVVTTGNQATRAWVANIVKEKLKVFPNYKPKDIVNDIKREYGIEINYFQAWRGKESAKEQLQGSYKEAYNQLPLFCEKLMEMNPGSFATFTTKEDSSFHRLFVSFHVSLYGFQHGCRPLLFLDSFPLKSKYQETLLAATSADGDDDVFPVAFAIVDSETDENWRWFLQQLKGALPVSSSITFVADRERGLCESIADTFETPYHGYCVRYLAEQVIRELKGQFSNEVNRLLVNDLFGAAYAHKVDVFNGFIDNLKTISLEAYNLVLQSQPENWANAFFRGSRYNHITSNFGELFYGWVSDAHELPITQMVDSIRGKIMDLMYTRQVNSTQWVSRLTLSMEEKLEKESLKARSLHVLILPGGKFEVRGESVEVVDIDHLDCSCKVWRLCGIPCCHAIAVIDCTGRSVYDYCSRYFTTEMYRLTYSQPVASILNVERAVLEQGDSILVQEQGDSSAATVMVTVTPPPARRPPGRPSSKRVGALDVTKRQLQCSRCKGIGHNKSTCKESVVGVSNADQS